MQIGQLVEVRSREEILRTLDKAGRLEGLPFMPEMWEYCGKRYRVYRIAHKTCDLAGYVNDFLQYEGRRMERTVFLEGLRCTGAAHGGCNASCLLFWKEAWLKESGTEPKEEEAPRSNYFGPKRRSEVRCTEADVKAATRAPTTTAGAQVFACQSTELRAATVPLSRWNLGAYVDDLRSGNVGLGRMLASFAYAGYTGLINTGLKIGRPLRALYDFVSGLCGDGTLYPHSRGSIPLGGATPTAALNLQPGEWVRVRSHKAILATVDRYNRNRGMCFVADQVPYCGRTFRVLKRVNQIIDERSGRMTRMKTPAVLLEGAVCGGWYTDFCLFCPRSTYPYWRECWLERVASPPDGGN